MGKKCHAYNMWVCREFIGLKHIIPTERSRIYLHNFSVIAMVSTDIHFLDFLPGPASRLGLAAVSPLSHLKCE